MMKTTNLRRFATILLLSLLSFPLLSLRCSNQMENSKQASHCVQDSVPNNVEPETKALAVHEELPQSEFSMVKKQFDALVADSCRWQILDKKDDLSFLLRPLSELELDSNYILSDFRKSLVKNFSDNPPRRLDSRDESCLRLYARKKSASRPDNDYFDKEHWKYRQCLDEKKDYRKVQGLVPFLDPFEKIRLSGSNLSLWQAYLLYISKNMFGMRNEANYNFEFLITYPDDVDRAIALIKEWEGEKNFNLLMKNDTAVIKKERDREHMKEVRAIVDSLKNLKDKNLDPVFSCRGDVIYIEHYSLQEFAGLLRRKIAIYYDRRNHKVKEIDEWIGCKYDDYMRDCTIAHYRHRVWF